MEDKESIEAFYEEIRKLAAASEQIYQLAEQELAPMVDSVIQNNCTDLLKIDKLLDDLLNFAGCDRILILFKRLCRYYYPINPEIVAYYVYAYKRMWDDDESVDSENVKFIDRKT